MQKKKANSQNNEKKKVDVCGENGAAEKDRCYTYMVRCSDGSLYTGWTVNLEMRVVAHNSGKGAKYTKSRRPVTLAYYEVFENRQDAMRREYAIKRRKGWQPTTICLQWQRSLCGGRHTCKPDG